MRSEIDAAADAYGEDALGPIFAKPLVFETDIERAEREEREEREDAYREWVESFSSWERDWWERENDDATD